MRRIVDLLSINLSFKTPVVVVVVVDVLRFLDLLPKAVIPCLTQTQAQQRTNGATFHLQNE